MYTVQLTQWTTPQNTYSILLYPAQVQLTESGSGYGRILHFAIWCYAVPGRFHKLCSPTPHSLQNVVAIGSSMCHEYASNQLNKNLEDKQRSNLVKCPFGMGLLNVLFLIRKGHHSISDRGRVLRRNGVIAFSVPLQMQALVMNTVFIVLSKEMHILENKQQ